jgi:hypothetical protein
MRQPVVHIQPRELVLLSLAIAEETTAEQRNEKKKDLLIHV